MNFVMQLTSILGAGLILGAFLGLQRRWWTSEKRGYLWSNLIGGGDLDDRRSLGP